MANKTKRADTSNKLTRKWVTIESITEAQAELQRIADWAQVLFVERTGEAQHVVIVLDPDSRRKTCGGALNPATWARKGSSGVYAEIVIPAHQLKGTVTEVATRVIHGLVHLNCLQRNIKECATTSRRHNKSYKLVAESVGLVVSESDNLGWSDTIPDDQLTKRIENELKPDGVALNIYRMENDKPDVGAPTTTVWRCACDPVVKVRTALKIELRATCKDCSAQFERIA